MPTILVVDDHEPTRRPLIRLLQQQGYQVVAANNAFQATALAKQRLPDLILLDVMMPPMDGLTFLMLLRQDGPQFQMPVILITGLSDPATIARAKELGVNEYLIKAQYAIDDLLSLVEKYAPRGTVTTED